MVENGRPNHRCKWWYVNVYKNTNDHYNLNPDSMEKIVTKHM